MPDKLCPEVPSPEDADMLSSLRAQIDRLDGDIQPLFEERMEAVGQIAVWKQAQGLPVLDAVREAEKLAAVEARAAAGLASYDEAFFRAVMELSRRRQEELPEEKK